MTGCTRISRRRSGNGNGKSCLARAPRTVALLPRLEQAVPGRSVWTARARSAIGSRRGNGALTFLHVQPTIRLVRARSAVSGRRRRHAVRASNADRMTQTSSVHAVRRAGGRTLQLAENGVLVREQVAEEARRIFFGESQRSFQARPQYARCEGGNELVCVNVVCRSKLKEAGEVRGYGVKSGNICKSELRECVLKHGYTLR